MHADGVSPARLYLVLEARPHGAEPDALLDAALRGGVDVVQLRDKELPDDELVAARRAVPAGLRRARRALRPQRPPRSRRGVRRRRRPRRPGRHAARGGPRGRRRRTGSSGSPTTTADERGRRRGLLRRRRDLRHADEARTPRAGSSSCGPRPRARASRGSRSAASSSPTSAESPPPARRGIAVVRAIRDADDPEARRALSGAHAPRWVNHPPPEPSWKTTVFSPLSSTTSK